ncbi:hypothetical protein [Methylobacterium aquaticum]|uniref:Uncharacterized protein n=1 Tax=Methylobacterium aquaticum TaxID=270351 RepID=A0A0C6G2J4_9HYPH|nr:hypothetical protein [Methylobacterium aquaticum]BAQ50350.1 hypothetical protein Maq22A_3p50510 [Methylobacterium aquaticum]
MPDRQLTDLLPYYVRGPQPGPQPGLEPWPVPTTKAERRAATHRMPKCRCGNVAGSGQALCGRCRAEEEERSTFKTGVAWIFDFMCSLPAGFAVTDDEREQAYQAYEVGDDPRETAVRIAEAREVEPADEEVGRDEILEAALHAHQHGDEEE